MAKPQMSEIWIRACATGDIDEEDVLRFDHEDRTYCIYNTPDGFFATDGMCTHEDEHLEDGIVIDCVIECPLHQGRFDVRNGRALSAPVCIDLKTWPVKIEDGKVYIDTAKG
jgi:3-phenylpropionate/trans-cinnamate dioxygenase ferredoxin subunit